MIYSYTLSFYDRLLSSVTWSKKKFFASGKTDKNLYEILKETLKQRNPSIYITDENGQHKEKLLGVLGKGGSKQAILLEKGRALLLPNMDQDSTDGISKRWERQVREEIAVLNFISSLGLLSPLSKEVKISLSSEALEGVIPAYISESFENLGNKRGWFIIDSKRDESCTWRLEKDFLFKSEEDRLNEKNWDYVLDEMLTDIAKISMYDIPAPGDSLNIAIVKKPPPQLGASEYGIRYFGFDFSRKDGSISIPTLQKCDRESDQSWWVERILSAMLSTIFSSEFGSKYIYEPGEKKPLHDLKERLIERYTKVILSRISHSSGDGSA